MTLWRHNEIISGFRIRNNIIEHIISRDERSYRHEYKIRLFYQSFFCLLTREGISLIHAPDPDIIKFTLKDEFMGNERN